MCAAVQTVKYVVRRGDIGSTSTCDFLTVRNRGFFLLVCLFPLPTLRCLHPSLLPSLRIFNGRGCGDWMEFAQDRDRWWALVSTAMNFRVP